MYNNERVILFDENSSPYIAHHGVKGQKWGIRRYQNEDGTLTTEGKKHYYGRVDAVQKDINSFKGHEKGIYSKSGKMLLSEKDVKNQVSALSEQRDKLKAKADARVAKDRNRLKKNIGNQETVRSLESDAKRKATLKTGAKIAGALLLTAGALYVYSAVREGYNEEMQRQADAGREAYEAYIRANYSNAVSNATSQRAAAADRYLDSFASRAAASRDNLKEYYSRG